jgi:chorismate synthase
MLRFLTAGESHGPALTTIIEGFPAGVPLEGESINLQLQRRQNSFGRGGRMKIERDRVEVLSGVRRGLTLGSPIALLIRNRDWENWHDVMAIEPGQYDVQKAAERALTRPRPGHADLAGAIKYRHDDLRNVLERASARETAARVAAGTVARLLLEQLGCRLFGQVLQIGGVQSGYLGVAPAAANFDELSQQAGQSPVFCADQQAAAEMMHQIEEAREHGDTLGGILEVACLGLPPGLGSYVQWDRRLDTLLAAAVMSIPSVKGVEIGLGFTAADLPGSAYHDLIEYAPERGFFRTTNRAGGLEGGMTNGEPLVMRAMVKPVPTLGKPLPSVDFHSKEDCVAAVERSDVCVVPAAVVIAEAMVAWVLAGAVLDKTGGDSLVEIQERWDDYRAYLKQI